MATSFTTWTALYNTMLDALAEYAASGQFKAVSYSMNGRSIQYRTIAEFKEGIEWVKGQADLESGSTTAGRTYAKNSGGGRW